MSASKFGKVSPRFTIMNWVLSLLMDYILSRMNVRRWNVNQLNVWWPGKTIFTTNLCQIAQIYLGGEDRKYYPWFTTVWNVFVVGFVCMELYRTFIRIFTSTGHFLPYKYILRNPNAFIQLLTKPNHVTSFNQIVRIWIYVNSLEVLKLCSSVYVIKRQA